MQLSTPVWCFPSISPPQQPPLTAPSPRPSRRLASAPGSFARRLRLPLPRSMASAMRRRRAAPPPPAAAAGGEAASTDPDAKVMFCYCRESSTPLTVVFLGAICSLLALLRTYGYFFPSLS